MLQGEDANIGKLIGVLNVLTAGQTFPFCPPHLEKVSPGWQSVHTH